MIDLYLKSGVLFSGDGVYRYTLHRERSEGSGMINFLMLNPSTADLETNDPTVERCQRRAFQMGYKKVVVTNLFALRSTDPKKLYKTADPIGPDNDFHILRCAAVADMVICAWGTHGDFKHRGYEVRLMLGKANIPLWCLKLTKTGIPAHPLYISYNVEPKPWIL